GPARAIVLRDVHEAVIAPGPDHAGRRVGLGDREDRAVSFGAGQVAGDRPAGPLLLAAVIAREVAADGLPGGAAVARAKQHVGAVIDDLRVVRRSGDRG